MGTAVQNAMRKKSQQWMKRGFSEANTKKNTETKHTKKKQLHP